MVSNIQEGHLPRTRNSAFVSSTHIDLVQYREKVRDTLLSLGLFPIAMEHFGSRSGEPASVATKLLHDANIYVGVVAWRYGTIPAGETHSVTHLEYLEARKLGMPCYLFLADAKSEQDYTHFPADTRDHEHAVQLEAFRRQIQLDHAVSYFSTPEELAAKIAASLHTYLVEEVLKSIPKNRKALLSRVRNYWISDVLDKSLKGETFIPLGLYERPTLVTNSFSSERQDIGRPEQLLRTGTTITEVYDEVGEDVLLIVGEPGSGKTTLLLTLARDLLDRARFSADHPMPVVFNLSAWAEKHQQLEEWLIAELVTRYKIGPTTAKSWITDNQIMPMLDGLDEVGAEHRNACVHAINTYWLNHSAAPLVVGSRFSEYSALDTKLVGSRAVQVQPMTPEQVADYLANDVVEFKALQAIVREQPLFQELAQNPLMLSILKRTYAGRAIQIDQNASLEEQSRQIFTDYVDTMLRRGKAKAPYTPQQTKDWLFWLSRQMQARDQTTFFIEHLQMDWLARTLPYKVYFSFLLGLVSLLVTFAADTILFEDWGVGAVMGLLDAGLAILFGWLIMSGVLIGVLPFFHNRVAPGRPAIVRFFQGLLGNSLCFSLFVGLVDGFTANRLAGSLYASTHGLLYAAFFVVLGRFSPEIEPAELLNWSWRSVRRNALLSLFQGLGVGSLLGAFNAVVYYKQLNVAIPTLAFGVAEGFALGIMIMLLRGYARSTLDEDQTIRPNQGILNSLSNATRIGIFAALATGGIVYLFYAVIINTALRPGFAAAIPPNSSILFAGTTTVALGYLFWLVNGGFAVLQHLALRLAMWQSRAIPLRYVRFLDYADRRILLRKSGGGYQFIHKSFLDYFADQGALVRPELELAG